MASILRAGLDIHEIIAQNLSPADLVAVSSTCAALRDIYRPLAFATLRWRGMIWSPPESLWGLIKHLHVDLNTDGSFISYGYSRHLSALESLHVVSATVSHQLVRLLDAAPHIRELDLARLSWGTNRVDDAPMPAFPPVPCRPRVVRFCSRLSDVYLAYASQAHASRMRAWRVPLATLLNEIGVGQVEALEVGLEALSLPIAVAYTWASLRDLVLTGFWVHPGNDRNRALDDPRMGIPTEMYGRVHLGSLLVACPRLAVLRVRWRRAGWTTDSRCVVWPADEPLPPSGTALPALDIFELFNPTVGDGILRQLPSFLRSLSLLTYPHTTETEDPKHYTKGQEVGDEIRGAGLTAAELLDLFSAAPMPRLRELRISIYGRVDGAFFHRITTAFPCLEVLEFHMEVSPGYLWTKRDLRNCTDALAPLANLRILRANAFVKIFDDLDGATQVTHGKARERPGAVRRSEVVATFFDDDPGAASPGQARFPALVEVWLPNSLPVYGTQSPLARRVWAPYKVQRNPEGRADIQLEEYLRRPCVGPEGKNYLLRLTFEGKESSEPQVIDVAPVHLALTHRNAYRRSDGKKGLAIYALDQLPNARQTEAYIGMNWLQYVWHLYREEMRDGPEVYMVPTIKSAAA